MQTLLMLLIVLSIAYLFSVIFKQFGLPRVVGQILAGVILGIGPLKNYLFDSANLELLSFMASLGIVLLFYYVGLEINVKAFTKNPKESLLTSVFNTAIPLFLGFLLMKFVFGYNNLVSIITGITLAVSA